jgi:hypothetical protein
MTLLKQIIVNVNSTSWRGWIRDVLTNQIPGTISNHGSRDVPKINREYQ